MDEFARLFCAAVGFVGSVIFATLSAWSIVMGHVGESYVFALLAVVVLAVSGLIIGPREALDG